MSNKPRKKKHSRASRDQRMFARSRVWIWESEPPTDGSDFVLHAQKKALLFGWSDLTSTSLVNNLFDKPRNWVIAARALVRSADGTVWMEQADATMASCKLLEVQGMYDTLRAEVMKANQTRHVFDCGWIAQTWLADDPAEADSDWVYHDTPAGIAPKHDMAGLGYTPERYERWQAVNNRRKEDV